MYGDDIVEMLLNEPGIGDYWSCRNVRSQLPKSQRVLPRNGHPMLREIRKVIEEMDLEFSEDAIGTIYYDLQVARKLKNMRCRQIDGIDIYVFDTEDNKESIVKFTLLDFVCYDFYSVMVGDGCHFHFGDEKMQIPYERTDAEKEEFHIVVQNDGLEHDNHERYQNANIDKMLKEMNTKRVVRKHCLFITKEDPEYYELLKVGSTEIALIDRDNNIVYFEYPEQTGRYLLFSSNRKDVLHRIPINTVNEYKIEIDNLYGSDVIFVLKDEHEEYLVAAYNSTKVVPVLLYTFKGNLDYLKHRMVDMLRLGTVYYQNCEFITNTQALNVNCGYYAMKKFMETISFNDVGDYDPRKNVMPFRINNELRHFQYSTDNFILVNLPVIVKSEELYFFLNDFDGVDYQIRNDNLAVKKKDVKRDMLLKIIGLIDLYKLRELQLGKDFKFLNCYEQVGEVNVPDICFYPYNSKVQVKNLSAFVMIPVPHVKIGLNKYVKVSNRKWMSKVVLYMNSFYRDSLIDDTMPLSMRLFFIGFRPPNFKPYRLFYTKDGLLVPCIKISESIGGRSNIFVTGCHMGVLNVLDQDLQITI